MSQIIKEGNTTVIRPGMNIVESVAGEFKQNIMSAIEVSDGIVVINFAEVEIVDSVGLGVLIVAHNILAQKGSALKIINVKL